MKLPTLPIGDKLDSNIVVLTILGIIGYVIIDTVIINRGKSIGV